MPGTWPPEKKLLCAWEVNVIQVTSATFGHSGFCHFKPKFDGSRSAQTTKHQKRKTFKVKMVSSTSIIISTPELNLPQVKWYLLRFPYLRFQSTRPRKDFTNERKTSSRRSATLLIYYVGIIFLLYLICCFSTNYDERRYLKCSLQLFLQKVTKLRD